MSLADNTLPEYSAYSPAYGEGSPAYAPYSPAYGEGSPAYAEVSPAYVPDQEELSKSYPPHYETEDDYRKYWDKNTQTMTHYFDKEKKTWIKNKTFNEIWNIKGGNEDTDFNVGETVFLRGSGYGNIPWKIKHIGDKFITVENDDIANQSGIEDSIQVVERAELMRPSDIHMANQYVHEQENPNMFDMPIMQNGGRGESSRNDPNIYFAPNIVVNTGNDNNMSIPGSPNDGNQMEQLSQPFNDGNVIRNVSMPQMNTPVQKLDAQESSNISDQSNNSNNSGGGILDFAKGFFIKKTE
jgi:hypothetical protein